MRANQRRLLLFVAIAAALTACQTKPEGTLKSAAEQETVTVASADPAAPASEADGASAENVATPDDAAKEAAAKPVVADPNAIAAYHPPVAGMLLTFRNNWASLPPVITYKIDGTVALGKAKYVKMTAIRGMGEKISAYYDANNFALKGYRDEKDKAVITYNPVEERYKFPMKPGDRWVTAWRSRDHRKEKDFKGGGVVTAVKFEKLELPSGTYRTMKVKLPSPPDMPKGMTHYVWFAPELGVTVKEQIGNGTMNWTQILEKVQLPENAS